MKTKLFILLLVSILFFSCNTLRKKQNQQQSIQNMESLSIENQDSHISIETSQWLQSRIEQLHYSNTSIHADSTITYQPDGGFQLSKVTIILNELKQQTTTSQETISSRKQESNQSHLEQELNVYQKQSNKQSEKEHLLNFSLKWLIVISFIALLAPLLLKYKKKTDT